MKRRDTCRTTLANMTVERKYLKGGNNRREGEAVNPEKRSITNHQRCGPVTAEKTKEPKKRETDRQRPSQNRGTKRMR